MGAQLEDIMSFIRSALIWLIQGRNMNISQISLLPILFICAPCDVYSISLAVSISTLIIFPCGFLEIFSLILLFCMYSEQILLHAELIYSVYLWPAIGIYIIYISIVAALNGLLNLAVVKPIKYILKGEIPISNDAENPKTLEEALSTFLLVDIPQTAAADLNSGKYVRLDKNTSKQKKESTNAEPSDSPNYNNPPGATVIECRKNSQSVEMKICLDLLKEKRSTTSLITSRNTKIMHKKTSWRGVSFRYIRLAILTLFFLCKMVCILFLYIVMLSSEHRSQLLLKYAAFMPVFLFCTLEVNFYSIDRPTRNYTHLFTILLIYLVVCGSFEYNTVPIDYSFCKNSPVPESWKILKLLCSAKDLFPMTATIMNTM
ncbi:hypothetical protein NERG_01079 [Nematocida ausubeli]|uniref:Uncharacterized protein n=1 Tax=Nematocida ausubeli (strain ATCC PRA-371 / ERTm2) TaxID=1913371 RepID=H8ZCT2_NEMA1|nr:hypothetical protein NERG_01079 [Nematocida ausubeli]